MADCVQILAQPWVFSQSHPLSTGDVVAAAERRGVALDPPTLRELYRRGDLSPLVEITDRAVSEAVPVGESPDFLNTEMLELRRALAAGRVRDLAACDFRPRLRFDGRRADDPQRWWNGLVYSRWQLLVLAERGLVHRLARRRETFSRGLKRVTLPPLDEWSAVSRERAARWALVVTALEPRYLPEASGSERLSLVGTELGEWDRYCRSFDPTRSAAFLEVTADEVGHAAEQLLVRAGSIDPGGDWSRLIRRAPQRAWKTLSGSLLMALDHWLAAEILLKFHEDLATRGATDPLPTPPPAVHHPRSDRLSETREPLDSLLTDLGINPHPGAVLVVEGETEERTVPRVFDRLGLRRTPDLIRLVCMRGVDKDLELLAAATAAPLLGRRHPDAYEIDRTPTRLLVAVDREGRWATDAQIAARRRRMVDGIEGAVQAQGAKIPREYLDDLVEVRTWEEGSFEFAHFSDGELADGMEALRPDRGGLDREGLLDRIASVRSRRGDIKEVWDRAWLPKPSKLELADVLWPVLAIKIDRWADDPENVPAPSIAEVVHEAWRMAQEATLGRFAIPTARSAASNVSQA